jgi:integrative and conjugative element protein (TIGR02256 family)
MLTSLPFLHSGAMLLVEARVLDRLVAFRQLEASAPEAGSILMGFRRGPHTQVTEATVPAARDVRRRFGFYRHASHHQRVAVRRWRESGETLDYVGEWHTHPADDPAPSGIDLKHWREIAKTSSRPMVFLIVGRTSNWCGIGLKSKVVRVS